MLLKHLNKNNLHHAYLIEGGREQILPEVLEFIESLGVKTVGNGDVSHISLDTLKIEDARNLRSYATEKSFSSLKKIFIITTNNLLLEAQNSLLKMFEEPILNTHFFLIVPDTNTLLKTFKSRFYLISPRQDLGESTWDAEKFINMPLSKRIDFIKELLPKKDADDEIASPVAGLRPREEGVVSESNSAKALRFLNALELVLHGKFLENFSGVTPPKAWTLPDKNFQGIYLEHIFKVREFLRMPGSSAKTLMESVALVIPEKIP